MAKHLILGDKTIQAIKPGDLRARWSDGDGLYLLLPRRVRLQVQPPSQSPGTPAVPDWQRRYLASYARTSDSR